MVGQRPLAARTAAGAGGGQGQAGAGGAERVADGDGAAVRRSRGPRRRPGPRPRVQARAWAAKASFSSITSKSRTVDAEPGRSASRPPGSGPTPMTRGATPAAAARPRSRPGARGPASGPSRREASEQGGRAVVDARGVAGGDRCRPSRTMRLQLWQRLERGVRAGCSSCATPMSPLAVLDRDRRDLAIEEALGARGAARGLGCAAAKASWSSRLIW